MTISSSSAPSSAQIADTLAACADAARPLTLERFRTQLIVDNKHATDFDPVTEADRYAETAIRDVISRAFPAHAIIGEEWDDKHGADSPYCWIIDPIDGTRAFISGAPVWGTLVGLIENGKAIAGLMEQPFTGERWMATAGTLTYSRNGVAHRVGTSNIETLSKARTSTTTPDMFKGPHQSGWDAVRARVLQVRYGLDCYAYCLLASGHIDLVVEAELKNVDIAPLIPIIEAAGGVVTTWDGGPAEQGGTCVAAATPRLHAEALQVLSIR